MVFQELKQPFRGCKAPKSRLGGCFSPVDEAPSPSLGHRALALSEIRGRGSAFGISAALTYRREWRHRAADALTLGTAPYGACMDRGVYRAVGTARFARSSLRHHQALDSGQLVSAVLAGEVLVCQKLRYSFLTNVALGKGRGSLAIKKLSGYGLRHFLDLH